jgi:glutamate racemase
MPELTLEAAKAALEKLAPGMRPIVLMDSGVGGLPYLEAARAVLPGECFVYLADRAGFPYGTKAKAEIEAIVLDRIASLVDAFDPKALVIACNTASQAALAASRVAHPGLAIVGTVPAIKPAAQKTKRGVIGVMATEHALVDPYLDDLIASHAPGVRVIRAPAQSLVSFVERDLISSTPESRRKAVDGPVRSLVEGGADEIVLACTHFLHVADDIAEAARDIASELHRELPVSVIDSREGVARRLREVLIERGLALPPPGKARAPGSSALDGVFMLSGPLPFEPVYADFARLFRLFGPFSLDRG